jgi:tRNA nucleotidyltransferase/poly(A) polymerase
VKVEEQVIVWLAQQATPAYLVGGSVRDRLLGRQVYDLDVAVDGDGLVLARHLADHFGGAYYPLDEARRTGRALLTSKGGKRLVVDVARFRGPDLNADLADRDFTINALAADVRALDVVIDYHNGLADLKAGLVRPVSEDSVRNDPLRALRAVRHAAELRFELAPETVALIHRDGLALAGVSAERIRDELARLLAQSNSAPYMDFLDDLGLLCIILPELEPLRDLAQPRPHHLDGLAHSLETVRAVEMVLTALSADDQGLASPTPTSQPLAQLKDLAPFTDRLRTHLDQMMGEARSRKVTLKLAALLHDTGKPAACTVDAEGRIRFISHQKQGARIAAKALQRLCFSRVEVRLGETIIRYHMRPLLLANQGSVSSRAIYRFFRDTRDAGVDVLLHALADHRATYDPNAEDDRWPRLVALAARMLSDYWERLDERVAPPALIDGHDLLREFGVQPGPRIGELLEAVREAQVEGQLRSSEEALALVGDLLAAEGRERR